eukprot:TRINITY_DN17132_c0_g1_i1.p2 TRINITY_DN17132_c0_g1~~TRINITY_DN17132_c0_g1_i1.p2  ORF type:complete len:234 (-),score=29.45 TRINITY_DN17132_c0_g1_i1:89-790(-)
MCIRDRYMGSAAGISCMCKTSLTLPAPFRRKREINIGRKLKSEIIEFQETLRTLSKDKPCETWVYVDKLELEIEKHKKPKARKFITLLLALNHNGTAFQLFVTTPSSSPIILPPNTHLSTSSNGALNSSILSRWFHGCIRPFSASLLLSGRYRAMNGEKFGELLRECSMERLMFPEGASCVLNPFRKISPQIASMLEKKCAQSLSTLTFDWISEAIKRLVAENEDAFNIFKPL